MILVVWLVLCWVMWFIRNIVLWLVIILNELVDRFLVFSMVVFIWLVSRELVVCLCSVGLLVILSLLIMLVILVIWVMIWFVSFLLCVFIILLVSSIWWL